MLASYILMGTKLLIFALTAGLFFGTCAYSFGADGGSPVLVELFTSEGCSSCPPADVILQRMDSSQPVPGAHLIVLSEHVDYWNHDGWKDPYSSSLVTVRQEDYARKLGLKTVFTPQFIVDGTGQFVSNDPQQVIQTLEKAAASAKIPIQITSLNFDNETLHAHIEIPASGIKHDADIYLATALNHADSQVLRGENTGKHLTHVAVVENLTKVGKLKKNQAFNQDIQIKLHSSLNPQNLRVVAFVQEPGPGEVLGSAMQEAVK